MDPIYPWLDPVEVRRLADRLMRPERQATVAPADAGFDDGFVGFTGTQPFSAATPARPVAHTASAARPPFTPVVEAPPQTITPPPLPQPAQPAEEPSVENVFQAAPEPAFQPAPEPALTHETENVFQAAPEPAPAPAPEPVAPQEPIAAQVPAPVPEPTVTIEENATTARGPFLDRITRFRDWMRHNFSATGIFILDRDGAVIFDESSHGRLHFLARSLALASRKPGSSGGNVHVKIGAAATLEVIPVETPYGCLVLGAVVPTSLAPPSIAAVMEALAQVATPPA